MQRKFMYRVLTFVLALVILALAPVRVYATGLGGIASGSVVSGSLSLGYVGLLILGAFGVCYAVEYADEIGASLENALDLALQAEIESTQASVAEQEALSAVYSSWIDSAKSGLIKLWSGAGWIFDAVKDWAAGFLAGDSSIYVEGEIVTAEDGYALYNGLSLPLIPKHSFLYSYIVWKASSGSYFLYALSQKMYVFDADASNLVRNPVSSQYNSYKLVDNAWVLNKSANYLAFVYLAQFDEGDRVIWCSSDITNYDTGDLFFSASAISYEYMPDPEYVFPGLYTGGIWSEYSAGSDISSISVPDINVSGVSVTDVETITGSDIDTSETDGLSVLLTALLDGTITWEQYWTLLGVYSSGIGASVPVIEVEDEDGNVGVYTLTNTGVSDVTVTPISGTLADTATGSFIGALVDAITAPFEWLANTLLAGIQALFVPSEDFLTEKVDALRSEFGFADSIIGTFEMFGDSLFSVDTSPPIIYIDLSQSEGSYYLGAEVVFVDLTWYEKYKPTVDILLSAFMWLCFFWRVGKGLPNIIRGVSGDVPDTLETGLTVRR